MDVDWGDVADVNLAGVHIRTGTAAPATLADYELLLERHVLDAQIVDLAGKRLTRVADVELVLDGRVLSVQGVEIGLAPLLRRLGLRFLVGHARSSAIRFALVSGRFASSIDRKSTRLNSSHPSKSRMPSSA